MLLIKEIKHRDLELCFELDLNTISLWTKKQWDYEFKKEGIKVLGLSLSNLLIGICVLQEVLDESQINYFAVSQKFQRQGFGTYLMNYLINQCIQSKVNKLLLEVSESNLAAVNFYNNFDFLTVGVRKNYYKDGSDALLKEKKLIKN